jgi:hypothetical protein
MLMTFSEMQAPFSGMKLWGASDGARSFCITFDEKHPDLGYRASWSDGTKTVYVDGSYRSMQEARKALRAALRKSEH